MAIYNNITELIGRTPIVKLNNIVPEGAADVYVKLEAFNPGSSVKDRIALSMIEKAEQEGKLKPGSTIVEATSGNTGIGLSWVGAAKGYKVVIVMPETMSVERRKIIQAYGAELVLTPGSEGMKGAIAKAQEIAAERDGFLPLQFNNQANPEVHERTTGAEILADFGADGLDAFVAGVGTGGTISGVSHALKTANSNIMLLLNSTKTFLFCSAQILLQDGRMMILGGDLLKDGRVTNRGVKDVNIFDPTSNVLAPARNDMTLPRWYGTATTLPTGEVYIQGGTDGEKHPEIRKADGTFKALTIDTLAKIKVGPNEMAAFENNYPRNFVAPNGKIFGFDPHFMYEIDPYGNAGKGSVKMLGAHWDYPRITEDGKEDWEFYRGWQATSTAVMVRPGLIFQFGGGDMTGNMNNGGPSKATLIDINGDRPKLFDLPAMKKTYHWSNATVLADGNVLVSGGSTKNLLVDVEEPINEDAGEINYATMLFNPDTRQWTPGANISEKRLYHSVTLLLPDATVLSTGGGQPGPVDNLNAQIYRPPYLFNADGTLAKRPVLKGEVGSGAVAMVAEPASTFHIETADANDIARVTLVKTGAVTHSFDMEQRFNEVKFRVNGNGLDIELPKNKYLTPPGFYHVFAFNKAGVPSKSRMIRINPSEKAPF